MRRVWCILFSLSAIVLYGQQQAQFSQFMLNKYGFNPAYGGMDRSLSLSLMYRDQYSSLTGNPKNFNLSGHTPFYIWNGAIGFQLSNQSIGEFNHSALSLSYNYVMNTDVGFLSFGGRAGGEFTHVNGQSLITPEGNYEGSVNHNDPLLDNMPFTGFGLTWQAGAYFYNNTMEAGLSLGEVPSSAYRLGQATFSRNQFCNAFFEYKYPLSRLSSISTGLFAKTDFIHVQTDVYMLYRSEGGLIGGIAVRGYDSGSLDAVALVIGSRINQHFVLSYSYDIGLSGLRKVNEGSHEVILSYNLNKLVGIGLPPKVIYNPRYL